MPQHGGAVGAMNRLKLKLKRAALKSAAATGTDPIALARTNLKIGRNFYDEGDYPNFG